MSSQTQSRECEECGGTNVNIKWKSDLDGDEHPFALCLDCRHEVMC